MLGNSLTQLRRRRGCMFAPSSLPPIFCRDPEGLLTRIVTMDETIVSFHTTETNKKQSKQWTPKRQPGSIKARVHATKKKQMVTVFFDAVGPVYTHITKKGSSVTGASAVKVLKAFLKQLKKKRPGWEEGYWFLHWENLPAHSAGEEVLEHVCALYAGFEASYFLFFPI